MALIPGSGRSPGEGNGNPLPYSCLEKSTERGCSPWGREELDTTERLTHSIHFPDPILLYYLHLFLDLCHHQTGQWLSCRTVRITTIIPENKLSENCKETVSFANPRRFPFHQWHTLSIFQTQPTSLILNRKLCYQATDNQEENLRVTQVTHSQGPDSLACILCQVRRKLFVSIWNFKLSVKERETWCNHRLSEFFHFKRKERTFCIFF